MKQLWPGGCTIEVAGTFTKTVADGTGYVGISLATGNDEVIFMYGQFASQTHAGGGDALNVGFSTEARQLIAYIAQVTVDANQTVNLPTAEADATVAVGNSIGMHTIYQRLVTGTDQMRVGFADMKFATSETFTLRLKFRSKTGAALTVTPSEGTWTPA